MATYPPTPQSPCLSTSLETRQSLGNGPTYLQAAVVPGQCGYGAHPSQKGGTHIGPNPTDRGKPGAIRHLIVDRTGIPLVIRVTAANVHDVTLLESLRSMPPPIKTPRGQRRRRPAKLHADKAYASVANRAALRRCHIACRIARVGIEP